MEFESSEKKRHRRHTSASSRPNDGRIVHGHVFVGEGTGLFGPEGRDERERETLEGARRNHGDLVSRLQVFHAPANFRFTPNIAYRVDTKARRLVELVRRKPKASKKGTAGKQKR